MTIITLPALGVDIGGVIIDRNEQPAANDPADAAYLATPPVRHAMLSLAFLNRKTRFRNRIHLISRRRNLADEEGDRAWLARHAFHDRTGIPPGNVHFCQQRHEKASLCTRFAITHAIDDRLEIIASLDDIVPHRILFHPDPKEITRVGVPLTGIHVVQDWKGVFEVLRTMMPSADRR
ncbi:MAG: hypothetical protein Q7S02_04260 [bacterium]|nr:hypothetical protein [bacterium]